MRAGEGGRDEQEGVRGMIILGLTGSIAMGKSTAAAMLRRLGLPVHDADAVVHRLLGRGGAAVPAIARLYPEAAGGGAVDRRVLGALAFTDPAVLRRIEAILHPMVRDAAERFLKRIAQQHRRMAVLDIPLLFETGGERRVDRVLVVHAPAFLQRQRVLARPGMTPERLAFILGRQMPSRAKCRRADWVIPTGLGRAVTLRALKRAVRLAKAGRGHRWPPRPGSWRPGGSGSGPHARNRPRY